MPDVSTVKEKEKKKATWRINPLPITAETFLVRKRKLDDFGEKTDSEQLRGGEYIKT